MKRETFPLGEILRESGAPAAVVLALLLVLAGMAGQLRAREAGDYPAPDISKFIVVSEEDGDGDGDGLRETHVVHYKNVAGDKVFSMTTKGRLWAWSA